MENSASNGFFKIKTAGDCRNISIASKKEKGLLATPSVSVGASTDELWKAKQATQEQIEKAKTEAFDQLKAMRGEIEKRRDEVEKHLKLALGWREPSDGDSNEALAREMRENRIWQRLKPVLDKTPEEAFPRAIAEFARQFAAEGEKDSLAVLREELPMYLRSRFAGAELESVQLQTNQEFDTAVIEFLPDAAEALNLRRELEVGTYQLNLGISTVEAAIKAGDVETQFTGWNKGDFFALNETEFKDYSTAQTLQAN